MSVELDKIKDLEKQIAYLQGRNAYYEQDGIGKLYRVKYCSEKCKGR